ncbi:MAG: conjugal transfer protein TraH, partial [Dehalococcoidia bacterium]|nr:conjugal transfer protein TraH [Dehalococcoidia bacterium]
MSARIRSPHPNRPRVLAASLAIALYVSPLAAGGGLEDFYNSVTAYHNVTAPQSIKGQAAHIYTGGSLYTRTPNRTYSLASFSPPSLRAGCGGIDAFGGAFSFINADEFVQMLRNIGQNALGLFFYTALQAMAPEIAEINKDLKNLAQRVNALNINSCEMAKHLVDASGIERMRDTNTRTSFFTALKNSLFGDAAEGQAKVFGNDAKAQQTQNAVKSDPDANARLIMGNLVWRAMNRGGLKSFLGEKEMRMAMSAVGAVVFSRAPGDPENEPPRLTHKPRTLTFQRLLGKGSGAAGEASKPKIITCLDGAAEDQCTVMGEEDYDGKPFADLAAEKMG